MEIEIYETNIGVFKVIAHPEKANVVFVQTCLPVHDEGVWEDMGYMKKKDFLKLIKPHAPRKKKDAQNTKDPTDPFWQSYVSI